MNAHEMKQQLDQEAVAKDQKLEAQLLACNALGSRPACGCKKRSRDLSLGARHNWGLPSAEVSSFFAELPYLGVPTVGPKELFGIVCPKLPAKSALLHLAQRSLQPRTGKRRLAH